MEPGRAGGPGRVVFALALAGATVYLGGNFERMGGADRASLAAVQTSDGAATAWNPGATLVRAIAPSGSDVFVGGQFVEAGGRTVRGLAKLNTTNGNAAMWDAQVGTGNGFPEVTDIEVSGGKLYITGGFEEVAGQERIGVAAVDPGTGALAAFGAGRGPAHPAFTGASAIEVSGSSAWVGGSVPTLFELPVPSGAPTGWDPTNQTGGSIQDIDLGSDGTLHVGGFFSGFFTGRLHYAASAGYAQFRDHGAADNVGLPHVRFSSGLHCTPGVWDGNTPMTFAYVWRRDGVAIPGATEDRYAQAPEDGGHALTCRVTATNAEGSDTATSAAVTAPVIPPQNNGLPVIGGTPAVGSTLTCSAGQWLGSTQTFAFAWLRDGIPIAAATTADHVVVEADRGTGLACRVTASNTAGCRAPTASCTASRARTPTATEGPTPSTRARPSPRRTRPTAARRRARRSSAGPPAFAPAVRSAAWGWPRPR